MKKENVKQLEISTVIFLLFLSAASSFAADTALIESSQSGLILSYRPANPVVDSLETNNKLYTIYKYDNHTTGNDAGNPTIPYESIFFAAPDGAEPAIELSQPEITTHSNVVLVPIPDSVPDDNGFASFIYAEDPVSYALSGYKPSTFAHLGRKIVIDGIAVWELILHPLLFDAAKATVAMTGGFDVTISFGTPAEGITSRRLPEYAINRDSFYDRSPVFKKAETGDSPFSTGDWYKIKLSDNGMYRITGTELEIAGFPVGTVSTNTLHMYYGGGKVLENTPYDINTDSFMEIAVKVDDGGDGIFDADDEIVFYGESISRFILEQGETRPKYQNYPYADADKGENAYWLCISDAGAPKRIQPMGETPSSSVPAITTSSGFIHLEKDNYLEWIDYYKYESGLEWYWDTITQSAEFVFNAPLRAPGEKSTFRVGLRNGGKIENQRYTMIKVHEIIVTVNEVNTGSHYIDTSDTTKENYIEVELDDTIKPSSNLLSLWRYGGHTGVDNVRLDWIELDYAKELKLEGGNSEYYMMGTASKEKYEILQFMSPSIEIYNTTDAYNISEVSNSLYNSTNRSMTFQTDLAENELHRFTLSSPDSYLSVSSISKRSKTNLRSTNIGANYIIITHKDFRDQAVTLANWRSRDSETDPLSTMVVDVEDIYDEFGWGVFDPTAIRDYLKFAYESYTDSLRFCCFMGDAISKFKNLSEKQEGSTFVPTFTEVYLNSGLVTDDYFTWFDGNRSPYLAIGRICVNDTDTAKIAVNKIIQYEKNPEPGIWRNRVLWIADDELEFQGEAKVSNKFFTLDIEDLDSNGYIPHNFERKKILLIDYPLKNFLKPEASEELIKSLNDGYLISNFIGHGNNDVLSHENILRGSRDIELLNNEGRQSLLLAFSCSVGQFDKPETTCLAELLNLRKGGGCIGVIAATRVTYNFKNVRSSKSFFKYLFDTEVNPGHRIGIALKKVKQQYSSDENSNRYVLFGDPATHLMIPRYGFNVASMDTLQRLEKLDIHGTVTDGSNNVPYEGKLYINAQGPRIHKNYSSGSISIDYSIPGKTFYKGEIEISGNSFDTSLVAPLDLQSDISDTKEFNRESKIYLFAAGETNEASAVIDSFYIGGISPDAAEDNTAPEIAISFDGNEFDDGEYIRRQPTMTLTISDESGLNILGNRGHNIKLLIDKTESVVLTDELQTVNGYTEGTIEYVLPVQTLGEHTFQISAYDSYNNSAKKTVRAQVVGSESGDISIMDLLNYPNPMGANGTTFTFSLNDDARHADIKIYSQSGRLVDTTKFSAEYGFNQVYWTPPIVLANGVYFYKINIVSMNGRKTSKIEKLVVMR
jgi:hypothetical protein